MREDVEKYNAIYAELYNLIGEENMIKVFQNFGGMQVSFPSRIYTKEYIAKEIRERYDGCNGKELAREFGYTVKYFNQLIIEMKK